MFIIELTYTAPMEKIDKYLTQHVAFLEKYYASGNFILSGRKVPRNGGIILATAESKGQVLKMIEEDPFHKNNLADYTITELQVTKKADKIEKLIV